MTIVQSATRLVTRAADTTTAVAGSVGGAAVNGVIGGIKGTATGVREGFGNGSQSTPAAALTLAATGAAGLVEWPILLGVGGTALVVHQLNQRAQDNGQRPLRAVSSSDGQESTTKRPARATKSTPRKSTQRRRTSGK